MNGWRGGQTDRQTYAIELRGKPQTAASLSKMLFFLPMNFLLIFWGALSSPSLNKWSPSFWRLQLSLVVGSLACDGPRM